MKAKLHTRLTTCQWQAVACRWGCGSYWGRPLMPESTSFIFIPPSQSCLAINVLIRCQLLIQIWDENSAAQSSTDDLAAISFAWTWTMANYWTCNFLEYHKVNKSWDLMRCLKVDIQPTLTVVRNDSLSRRGSQNHDLNSQVNRVLNGSMKCSGRNRRADVYLTASLVEYRQAYRQMGAIVRPEIHTIFSKLPKIQTFNWRYLDLVCLILINCTPRQLSQYLLIRK